MSTIDGKYKLVSEEGTEAFIKATGGGEKEIKEHAANKGKTEVYESYTMEGNTIKSTTEVVTVEQMEYHLGQWSDLPDDDGPSKIFTKEIGKGQYSYELENSKFKAKGTRTFNGDEMVLTIIVNGVTETRRYKRVK